MKHLLLFPVLSMSMLQVNDPLEKNFSTPGHLPGNHAQTDHGHEKMSAALFKNQDFFRAEIPDFPFDVHFNVVGATVYFSGTNFNTVKTGFITSGSLKPVKNFMERCAPGSIIIFDDVKVIGPDKRLRTIQSVSYRLY